MRKYSPQEKLKIQRHPLWIKYSGAVPDELKHLVYPDEAKPVTAEPEVKRGRKPKAVEIEETPTEQTGPIETSEDGNGN